MLVCNNMGIYYRIIEMDSDRNYSIISSSIVFSKENEIIPIKIHSDMFHGSWNSFDNVILIIIKSDFFSIYFDCHLFTFDHRDNFRDGPVHVSLLLR